MFAKPELLTDFIVKYKKATPIALYYDHHKPFVSDWITKQITDFYFAGHPTMDKQLNVTNVSNHFDFSIFSFKKNNFWRIW